MKILHADNTLQKLTGPVTGCSRRRAVVILTGLGFLLGVDGFKFAFASSQGARLLPFLDRSCPLTVRV